MPEDDRAILGSGVVALAIQRCGIVKREVDPQQVLIGEHGRVERDLHALGMPGGPRADLLVTGLGNLAAGIARNDALDSLQGLEDGFDAPEATARERGGLAAMWGHGSSSRGNSGLGGGPERERQHQRYDGEREASGRIATGHVGAP